jgi:hypothetical protein
MLLLLILGWTGASFAATNEAVDPGGGGILLAPSGQVTVTSTQASLVKQARDLLGNVLPNLAPVTAGQEIYFVLYVDNPTVASATDIRITDLINETQFTYVPGSIETTDVAAGSNDAAIWAGAWNAVTDAVSGADIGSITDFINPPLGPDRVTVGAVAVQANQTLNIPAGRLRAIRFRVTVN